MARGSWHDDFRNKYGFGDGSTEEERDYLVRALLVKAVNKTPEFKRAKVKAVEYDRPGFHNHCLILLLPANIDEKEWLSSNEPEATEPDGVDFDEIVARAYEKVDASAGARRR